MMITNILFEKYILIYLIIINLTTFIVFALDKICAIKKKWRYKEISLLGMCFVGGAIGGFLAMHLFHHKTKKKLFVIVVPLIIIIIHLVIIMWFIK